jgi:glycosyltransferase involved in cell wall biosynthesis
MSAGLTPILSSIPAFVRLVSRGGVGLNVDADKPDAAAAAILSYVSNNPTPHAEARRRAMAVASRYDWQEVAVQYGAVYKNASGNGETIQPLVSSGIAG